MSVRVTQIVVEIVSPFASFVCADVIKPDVEQGDFLLAVLSPNDQTAQVVVPVGFTQLFPCVNDPLVAPLATAILYKIISNFEPSVYHFEMNNGSVVPFDGDIHLIGYRGMDQNAPINASGVLFSLDANNQFALPDIQPTQDGCALIGIMTQSLAFGSANENTPPAGYTSRQDNGFCLIMDKLSINNGTQLTGPDIGQKTITSVGENTYHIALNPLHA